MVKFKRALGFLAALTCLGAALYIVIDIGLPKRSDRSRGIGDNLLPTVGYPAPAFALRNLSNDLIALQPTAGAVTLLNFWSTTCAPCRSEMRDLQRLHEQHHGRLRILAVNLGESRAVVSAWRAERSLTYELLLDPALAVARRYQIRGLPTTYLLDEQLVIRATYFGPVTFERLLSDMQRLAGRQA